MNIGDIVLKVGPDNRVLGIMLDQDVEALLQEKLNVKKADFTPEEWQELIKKVETRITEYFRDDNVFNAFRVVANSYIINKTFEKCQAMAL